MLSLLEKVCSHWSHHMFEPRFVMEEINPCHYCRCVHLCKSIRQPTALLLPKVQCLWEISLFIKLQTKDRWKQRTLAILIDHRYFTLTGTQMWLDSSHSWFVSCYVTWSSPRQQQHICKPVQHQLQWGPRYNGQKCMRMHKHIYKYSNYKIHWPSPQNLRCQ